MGDRLQDREIDGWIPDKGNEGDAQPHPHEVHQGPVASENPDAHNLIERLRSHCSVLDWEKLDNSGTKEIAKLSCIEDLSKKMPTQNDSYGRLYSDIVRIMVIKRTILMS